MKTGRFRRACYFTLFMAAVRSVSFADESCHDADDLISRVARADESALREAQSRPDCFQGESSANALAAAAGEFFDAKPRRYIQTMGSDERHQELFLRSLKLPSLRLGDDVRSITEIFKNRILAIDANEDLLGALGRRDASFVLINSIDNHLRGFRKANPIPYPMVHPLLGVPMSRHFVSFEPLLGVWSAVEDLGRADLRTLAATWDRGPPPIHYVVVGGFDFVFDGGSPKPNGLVPVVPWVQRVEGDQMRGPVEFLGPVSEMYSNPRIPADVIARLCDSVVSLAGGNFEYPDRLQRALDERIKREPGAGFPRPLRDALIRAKYDVRRYKAIPVTQASQPALRAAADQSSCKSISEP
jgi:hypothetical protein